MVVTPSRVRIWSQKFARRPIGAVGDQEMVARHAPPTSSAAEIAASPDGKQRHAGALRPFEFLQRLFERLRGRRAAPAILVARAMGDEILGARIEHGRGVIDRRIDEAVVGGGIAPGRHHAVVGRACGLCGRAFFFMPNFLGRRSAAQPVCWHCRGLADRAPMYVRAITPASGACVNPLTLRRDRSQMHARRDDLGTIARYRPGRLWRVPHIRAERPDHETCSRRHLPLR